MEIDINDFFRNVTVRICSSLHLEVSMSRSVEYMRAFMPIDEMYVALYDDGTSTLRVIARSSASEGILLDQYRKNIPEAVRESILRFNERTQSHVEIVKDPRSNTALRFLYPFVGYDQYSCMMLPLKVENDHLGVVLLFACGKDRYEKIHSELLHSVAQPFGIALANTIEHLELIRLKMQLEDENRCLRQEHHQGFDGDVIGRESGLKKVFELVEPVAPLASPVLLLGETGTGKEVIASYIHKASTQKKGPFVAVNCGAVPPTLVDSELFGYEKGAFTNAVAGKQGFFERAQNGTIFLDEIGELPPDAQIRLLRVIQEKRITRIGSEKSIALNVRIICATNRNLDQMVQNNEFRQDLFFRISVFPIHIPALRHRRDDIPLLAECFVRKNSADIGLRSIPVICTEDMACLKSYDWPGNVRELQNIIERAVILRKGNLLSIAPLLSVNDLYSEIPSDGEGLDGFVSRHITEALKKTGGRISGPKGAAKFLGIHPSTLRHRMKRLGLL